MKIKILVCLIIIAILTGFFSYKLLGVPTGLTRDEVSFGLNAELLSRTGRDQNQRFMPLFVLSSSGTDWRQPVTQYYLTGLFKIFGPSVFLLRFSSVLVIVGSILALFWITQKMFGRKIGVIAGLVMLMTPLIMIQSHMALDNIMPIPFTIAWLWFCFNYLKTKEVRWIVLAGVMLGASMYTYKGMRAIVPVWSVLTAIIILTDKARNSKEIVKRWGWFFLAEAPFILIIPWIEKHYAGAMMGEAKIVLNNLYDFFGPYLSSFDMSNLFITGDIVSQHSTGKHGVYLLASAPWFFIGVYRLIRKKDRFSGLLLVSFFLGPMLLGLVGSIHRFSRLMMMIPIYSMITGIGFIWIIKQKEKWIKMLAITGAVVAIVNYADFIHYYWTDYPGITFSLNGDMGYYRDFAQLAKIAKNNNLEPVMHDYLVTGTGESGVFFQMIYFQKLLKTIPDKTPPPQGTVLLSERDNIEDARKADNPDGLFSIYLAK